MKRINSGNVVLSAVVLLAVTALGLTGCGILDEGGTPQNARVTMEGGGGQAIDLVTSNDFTILYHDESGAREIFLNSSDTSSVTGGLDKRYSLGSGVRFYVLASSEVVLEDAVTLKVFIDGQQRYSATSTFDGNHLEFVYSVR